jgi:molybdate/tungstate transport system substrate-binding protein
MGYGPLPGRTGVTARASASGVLLAVALTAILLLAAGGAASGAAETAGAQGGAPATRSGTVQVAYAGSLAELDEKVIGPGFSRATGYGYQGRGTGSDALSAEIESGEITPNVFESVGSPPITVLEPRFTRWYVAFASSPLVVAYNPHGRYAGELRLIADGRRPLSELFRLMASPGFRLGRTDPNVDPQGAAFVEMVELAQHDLPLPAPIVRAILGPGPLGSPDSPEIFSETALEPRLQAGQLDAASAFLPQARELHLPYIELPASFDFADPAQTSAYAKARLVLADGRTVDLDVTEIGTGDRAAAGAFVAYLLSHAGSADARAVGYSVQRPKLVGPLSAVPPAVRHALGS